MSKIFLIELHVVIVFGCHGCGAQNSVQWEVLEKINKYGDNLTLACTASDKSLLSPNMTLSWHKEQQLCATDNIPSDATKYEPQIVSSKGGYLKIISFGQEDINKTYRCTIDFLISEWKKLSADAVFNDKVNVLKHAPLDKDGLSQTNLAVIIASAVICTGILLVGGYILYNRWKRDQIISCCKRGHTPDNPTESREPDVELMPEHLQDPNNAQGTSVPNADSLLLDVPVDKDYRDQIILNGGSCSNHFEDDTMDVSKGCLAENEKKPVKIAGNYCNQMV